MFDDEGLAVARLFRDKGRSLLAIDSACLAGADRLSRVDVNAMLRGDPASWADWAALVVALRRQTEHSWLPIVLGWFAPKPLVLTNLTGRQPIRAGASPHLCVEVGGALERLVCTGTCGIAPESIVNDDLNASPERLVARFGRCKSCKARIVPSVANGLHPDVQFDNDRALDAWRSLSGKAVALVIANEGSLREQALRIASAAGASVVSPPRGRDVAQWVNEVDHAVVSLGWGAPGHVSIGAPE